MSKDKFFLTTAINYTNGVPHMGHAYEAILSDVISRYHRAYGRDVFFLTGTDEHGQKIANTAEKLGKNPQQVCDMYAEGFKALNSRLLISNDYFVRTTDSKHKESCQMMWRRAREAGDIYLDNYCGWYNVREETFVPEIDAKNANYIDTESGLPLKRMEEPSFFFRMSKYQDRLIEHINANPACIQPENRRNEILSRLKEPLQDLSVSRTNFSWGIQVPDEKEHVMYVWFDALTNYLSGIDFPDGEFARFWPADVHVIGKDISWFHCVIWPCMLMSANIPLPKVVFAHGFVHAADGKKMSKTIGNVLDPNLLLNKYSADTLRFYIATEAKFGADLPFSEEALVNYHNASLADVLGNLVHRATSLCAKSCKGEIPDVPLPGGDPPFDLEKLKTESEKAFAEYCVQEAAELVVQACRDTNKYLTTLAPWTIKDPTEKAGVIRAVLEACYVIALFFEPFVPLASAAITEKLGTPRINLKDLTSLKNLKAGTPVTVGSVLFTKLEKPAEE